ncbi:hypothetical protein EDB19DRAFT_1910134 [Suillus lakei]|nr:hypothetical protein EDB19DRAFT_1910134 [Suillus lakei]
MTQTGEAGFRECAYKLFSGCPKLVMVLQTDAVLTVFRKGLQDSQRIERTHKMRIIRIYTSNPSIEWPVLLELPLGFQCIPSMLANYHWRLRHAGLMAIAAIVGGTSKVMQMELGKVVDVHSHAAAALINFCEGVERDTLVPYLDPIVERLPKMLNPGAEDGKVVKDYVQEQAITTLAMVAVASETTFAKVSLSSLTCSWCTPFTKSA